MNVVNVFVRIPRFSVKRQDQQPEHVERRQSRSGHANEPEELSIICIIPCAPKYGVFAEETGKWRNARDGYGAGEKCRMCPRHVLAQAAHLADVLHTAHSMNDTAGAKEQQSFEEGVSHQMKYAGGIRAGAACQKHVAKLAHRGIRQNLLDVGLNQTNGGRIDGGE